MSVIKGLPVRYGIRSARFVNYAVFCVTCILPVLLLLIGRGAPWPLRLSLPLCRLLGLLHSKLYRDNYRGTPCQLPRCSAVVTAERVGSTSPVLFILLNETCVEKTSAQCNLADSIAYCADCIVFALKNPAENLAYYYAYNPTVILYLPLVFRRLICSL